MRKAAISPPLKRSKIMSVTSLFRTATLALSLVAASSALTVSAFAAAGNAAQQQPQAQQSSPYDNPDFTIQDNNIQS
jgi:hypothetical protein